MKHNFINDNWIDKVLGFEEKKESESRANEIAIDVTCFKMWMDHILFNQKHRNVINKFLKHKTLGNC